MKVNRLLSKILLLRTSLQEAVATADKTKVKNKPKVTDKAKKSLAKLHAPDQSGGGSVKQAKQAFKNLQKGRGGSTSGELLPAPVDRKTANAAAKAITGKSFGSTNGKHNPFKYAKKPAVLGHGPEGKKHYKAYAFPWKCVCLAGSSACKKGKGSDG